MKNYIGILLIIVFFSSCSCLDKKKYHFNDILEKRDFDQKFFNRSYIGMTREQIIYIFGMPIISDAFNDAYHYHIYTKKEKNSFHKKILNFYFKNDKVSSCDIQ
ncbi:outer membrane protein assembly factor BamE [Buchnera aphidicola]|uniref:outer membrane protein assembly factor BamE n=1 Tax=Buchnera aphidicola TaxID=9 RepID=UPI003464A6D3